VSATAHRAARRSEEPKNESHDEHNYSDGPQNRYPRDETNQEENQAKNNHNASGCIF
jgi:hypothetical protein